MTTRATVGTFLLLLPLLPGLHACQREPDVRIYCALDQQHSEPILREFERSSGLKVEMRFDTEADKTVGLVTAIEEERGRPRCDVFWNNEVAQTIRLKRQGLLDVYRSPAAADIPANFQDPDGMFTGFAARARVFIINTRMLPDRATWPKKVADLAGEAWKGKGAMARPLTGTTLTHAAALYSAHGEEWTEKLWTAMQANGVTWCKGNAHVMRQVSEGQIAFGLTDTDDYRVAVEKDFPVESVYPDHDGDGTLLIPNSVALIKGGPHPEAARKLVDYILSKEVEGKLAACPSAQIPVRASVPRPAHVRGVDTFKVATVDWARAAEWLDRKRGALIERFSK
jgi:iron(III) transport system substrate-binding protein